MTRYLTSRQNPLVKHLIKLRDNRGYRQREQRVLVEGRKLVQELLQENLVENVIVDEERVSDFSFPQENLIVAAPTVIQKLSALENSEGVLAEVKIPPEGVLQRGDRVLVLDGVSDPGNLGTLLRTASAFGWNGVYLVNGCVDPFNGKALQAAKGATFRLPIMYGSVEALEEFVVREQMPVVIADIAGEAPESVQVGEEGICLVLGSEAHGPSEHMIRLGRQITLPMNENTESLNVAVAGGIIIYLLNQQVVNV